MSNILQYNNIAVFSVNLCKCLHYIALICKHFFKCILLNTSQLWQHEGLKWCITFHMLKWWFHVAPDHLLTFSRSLEAKISSLFYISFIWCSVNWWKFMPYNINTLKFRVWEAGHSWKTHIGVSMDTKAFRN